MLDVPKQQNPVIATFAILWLWCVTRAESCALGGLLSSELRACGATDVRYWNIQFELLVGWALGWQHE